MRAVLFALVALAGCTENPRPEEAEALFERVVGYRDWQRAPGFEEPRESTTAHGDEVIIYVDETMAEALAEDSRSDWPVGSIVVKEGFEDGDLEFIAIMEKTGEGDTGWFFTEADEDGDPFFSGEPERCTGCHASGDDFLLAIVFPPYVLPYD